jgi:hypothetical protein
MTGSGDLLTVFLGALAKVEKLAQGKASDVRHRPGVVSAAYEWQFAEFQVGAPTIDLYVEIEVAEGSLTWALGLRQEQATSGWILDRGLTRNVTRHQEEVYSFPAERLDDADGLARRLPGAVAELFAREHVAPT